MSLPHNEIIDGLDQALLLIQNKMTHSKSFDHKTYSDMTALQDFLTQTKEEIVTGQNQFMEEMREIKQGDIIQTCAKQKEFLNTKLSVLEKQLTDFKPESTKETPRIKRAIHRLLSYLKKDYFVLDKSAKNILLKHVSATKKTANQDNYITSESSKLSVFSRKSKKSESDSTKPSTARGRNQNR